MLLFFFRLLKNIVQTLLIEIACADDLVVDFDLNSSSKIISAVSFFQVIIFGVSNLNWNEELIFVTIWNKNPMELIVI